MWNLKPPRSDSRRFCYIKPNIHEEMNIVLQLPYCAERQKMSFINDWRTAFFM